MKKIFSFLMSSLLVFSLTSIAYAGTSYSSSTASENALKVSGETKTLSSITVTKTGDASQSDENDFYGKNAAVLATDSANLTIEDSTITSTAAYGNGVFSYGEGTVINISDSKITTNSKNSGGIMVTGGGELNATDLTITTKGGSSAPIRSDRGGGTLTVDGGTYTSSGSGSPAIYSTADIIVSNATLNSGISEGVVVEGANSVTLKNTKLTSSHSKSNSDKSSNKEAVMIYQSMSGDASQGEGSFTMTGGSITAKKGDVFYVTNTTANITLDGVSITNSSDNSFLKLAEDGWGNSGSNGGDANVTLKNQTIKGSITVGDSSALNLSLDGSSKFTGYINNSGKTYVEIAEGGKWTLTKDSAITSLTCNEDAITLGSYSLTVNGEKYTAGTKSEGEEVEITTTTTTQNQQGQPQGAPKDGQRPPELPNKASNSNINGQPEQKTWAEGEKPDYKPDKKPDEQTSTTTPSNDSTTQTTKQPTTNANSSGVLGVQGFGTNNNSNNSQPPEIPTGNNYGGSSNNNNLFNLQQQGGGFGGGNGQGGNGGGGGNRPPEKR